MSLYRYRAKDRKGHKYKGIREGENEAQLVKSLAEDGLYCYFLQNEDRVVSMRHFTVPLKWLPPFCSQVSSMLSSGVPQSDILKTACKTAPTREMKAFLPGWKRRSTGVRHFQRQWDPWESVFQNSLYI